MILGLGLVLLVAGLVLMLNVAGAGSAVVRRVTSRNLGSLAPGYAATAAGFRVYAGLVLAVGLVVSGVGLSQTAAVAGVVVMVIGVVGFVVCSAVALAGEIRVYRSLTR